MAIPPRPDLERTSSRGERLLVLGTPLAGFVVPFIGPVAALATPLVAWAIGPRIWPVRRWLSASMGVVVLVVFWVVLVSSSTAWGSGDAVGFLLVPLCAPETWTWLIAPLAGIVAYGTIAALSVKLRTIWLWPLAAAAGSLAFAASWAVLDDRGAIRMVC